MTWFYVLAGVVSVGLLGYLILALINAEDW